MGTNSVLSTGYGFFRKKDLLFPDIVFIILSVLVIFIGFGGSYFLLVPFFCSIAVGFVAYFLLLEKKTYPLYWALHSLTFILVIPRDPRYTVHSIIAIALGFVLWFQWERKLNVRSPIALFQLLVFLIFYTVLPGISEWKSGVSPGYRIDQYADWFTKGYYLEESLPGFRYSILEAASGYSVLFLLPLLLKQPLALLLPVGLSVIEIAWLQIGGVPPRDFFQGPGLSSVIFFSMLLGLPGRNLGKVLPVSFLTLFLLVPFIFWVPLDFVPPFVWIPSYFFIESILIRIFLGDRVEKHESAPDFTQA
ncbi:hypothetical protein CH373_03475 [Leptospira perolatii]|uniref:Uncharacterized protein n=1 Tax=Leptospira perolatii TaxID=2023191 RepID=A0A2M9ZSZ4_9LEPT|nr:hypothetical protein [Leptospira perolatii]PJZ68734.1 hypothetical protein CH360_14355 [Leptospira perolatii]PJZ75089.1 hypothetical protein CH373_03475 [Leptospira perolatii]